MNDRIIDFLLIILKHLCNLVITFSICYMVKDLEINNLLIVIVGLLIMINLKINENARRK